MPLSEVYNGNTPQLYPQKPPLQQVLYQAYTHAKHGYRKPQDESYHDQCMLCRPPLPVKHIPSDMTHKRLKQLTV